jgi:PhoPQ-activated pathogenicity-related protein
MDHRPGGTLLRFRPSLPVHALWACALLSAPAWAIAEEAAEPAGPLGAYVAKPDESFAWVKRREGALGAARFVELTLTSQTWRDIVWRHQLFVVRPAEVANPSQAVLLIGGGRWNDRLAGPVDPARDGLPREAHVLAAAAATLKSPVAVLLHVPQQPILGGMVEDQAISFTFDQYLKTRDPEWPLLLPMVKSVVRAMDAVQQFARDEWSLEVRSFTLTGASKRGWTTWLTGAVDRRATALAPMVIDVLNMQPQMKHQLQTWGRFSEQIHDYTQRGLQDRAGTEAGKALNAIIDPYSYRQAFKQPKLIMLGTNDRYWPLDALNLYWDGLPGQKYVLYVPNNGHGLQDLPRIIGGLTALHRAAQGQLKLPKLSWDLAQNGTTLTLNVRSDTAPARVVAWTAAAPTRDFREARWTSAPAEPASDTYRYTLSIPSTGYAALFGEAMFEDSGTPYFLSTNVKIVGGAE